MARPGQKPKRKNVVWSCNLAYAVGLITTDGCLSPDGRHIDLTSKDTEQLKNFMHCIGRKIRISTKPTGRGLERMTRVQFSDVTLYQFLLEIGLTPRKSLTIGVLKIPDIYFFDFLRGSFDGDGSFYSYFDPRWRSSFMFYLNFTSASPVHIQWLQKTIQRLAKVSGHISRIKKNKNNSSGIETLRYAKKEARILMRLMYPNRQTIFLKRKRLKIERALRIVGESLSG